MVYMPKSEFLKEHKELPRILRTGTKAEREEEADKQESEGKEVAKENEEGKEVKEGHGIKRIEIEPAETGGFITTVTHKEKKGKAGMPSSYEEPDKHIHATHKDLSDFLAACFPQPSSRTKRGESKTSEKGGSRVDTYESKQGDEVGY